MACMSKNHQELNADGIGKCSVPMWAGGCPAGFCDRDAYGTRPPCGEWHNIHTNEMMRLDGKYNGYVPGLACPIHGGPDTRVFMDGDKWCAVRPDFVNLQESPAGFGDTPDAARAALATTDAGASK